MYLVSGSCYLFYVYLITLDLCNLDDELVHILCY